MTSGPWFLTPTAVHQWAELRGGIIYEQALGELIRICCEADERLSPKLSDSGLRCYRVRKPLGLRFDVQLIVSMKLDPQRKLPQLVRVREVEFPGQ